MTEQERKIIEVRDGVAIEDLTENNPDKRVYLMTADVFDKIGEKVEEGQLIFMDIACFEGEETEMVARAKKHVGHILGIQAIPEHGGRLENIKFFNLSIEEAEERGILQKPDVIQYIPTF